jgi:ATP-dependent helicase HrpA
VRLWPALKDDGDSVSLRFYNERHEAEGIHLRGQVRLAMFHWVRELRDFRRSLRISGTARDYALYLGGPDALEQQLWDRVFQEIFGRDLIRTSEQWNQLLFDGGGRIFKLAEDFLQRIIAVLETYGEVRRDLDDLSQKSHRKDYIRQRYSDLQEILPADFAARYEPQNWESLPRWLRAVVSRARKGTADPGKELRASGIWNPLRDRIDTIAENLSPMATAEKRYAVAESKVALQELRVALFAAGEVRSAGKISESRMKKLLDDIDRML